MISLKKLIPILIILVGIIIAQFSWYKYNNNFKNQIRIYNVETSTDDTEIMLDNFNIITNDNEIYIPNNYLIRKNNQSSSNISAVSLTISIDNQTIVDLNIGDIINNKNFSYKNDTLLKGIKLNKDSVLNVHFKYTLDGKSKDFYQDFEFSSIVKEPAATSS